MEESLVDTATILSAVVSERAGDEGNGVARLRKVFDDVARREFEARIYQLTKTNVTLRVYVTDAAGIVLFDSAGGGAEGEDYSRWNDVRRTLRGRYGARSTRSDPKDPATSTLHVAAPVIVGDRIDGVVTVCKPVVTSSLFIQSARRKIIVAACFAALAVALLGYITSAWVTRPIRQLTAYATKVRDGHRAALPDLGRTEIGVMGRALDEMRTALEGKEYVEHYVQTLTHELKGPLSAIQGAVELMQEDMPVEQRERFLKNVKQEAERMQRVVERLLLIAAVEARRELQDVEPVHMGTLVEDVVESMRPAFVAKGVHLATERAGDPVREGERFLLRQALSTLLQNALDFSPRGGSVVVATADDDDGAKVSVSDEGPGVPDYALNRVFESFYSLPRPDTGEKSSGLGLTFARGVAELHGGSLTIENRPHKGAVATLRLPA
jgi:two-component system sensor histidine kinase CreC